MFMAKFWAKFDGTLIDRPHYPPHNARVGVERRAQPIPPRPSYDVARVQGVIVVERLGREHTPQRITLDTTNAGFIVARRTTRFPS
jgi:hypothetical protein